MPTRSKEIAPGTVFGCLTVVRMGEPIRFKEPYRHIYSVGDIRRVTYDCRCVCGAVKTVRRDALVSGRRLSCGCQNPRFMKTMDGQSKTSEGRSYEAMISRCYNEASTQYWRYGARGITVCEEWRNSFLKFIEHVGPKPTLQHSIDRFPNNKGNYEPGNVRWASRMQQSNNLTSNRNIHFDGRIMSMAQWGYALGFKTGLIYDRIVRRGWPVSKALSTPPKKIAGKS